MTFTTYLEVLPRDSQRSQCATIIDCIRSAGAWEESIKWKHPFFALNGAATIKMFAATGWTNVYFYRGIELADPAGLFDEDENARMRKVQIQAGDDVPEDALRELVGAARSLAIGA